METEEEEGGGEEKEEEEDVLTKMICLHNNYLNVSI